MEVGDVVAVVELDIGLGNKLRMGRKEFLFEKWLDFGRRPGKE